jgi:Transposase domain (DUF772)
MERLTDWQAADALRTRIDRRYLLRLELTEVGVDPAVLREFRTCLLAHGAESRLLDAILEFARARSAEGGGQQRSDSTHILGAMLVVFFSGEEPRYARLQRWRPDRYPTSPASRNARGLKIWTPERRLRLNRLAEDTTPDELHRRYLAKRYQDVGDV